MINMMKWHHINTIKYQCTDLIINIIIIYKVKVHQLKSYQKLKSISFSEYHFNWLSFFSSITFSRGVNCFKVLRVSVRLYATSRQTFFTSFSTSFFNLSDFLKVWLNRSSHTFYLFCSRRGSQEDYNLGMMGPFCALNKRFAHFFPQ